MGGRGEGAMLLHAEVRVLMGGSYVSMWCRDHD